MALPAFEYKCQNRLARISCTSHEIETLIEILNPNKATGPDEISNKMLKAVAQEVSVPLNILLIDLLARVNFLKFGSYQMLYHYRKKEIIQTHRVFDPYHF